MLDLADRSGLPVPTGLRDGAWRFRDSLDFIDQYVALCGLMTELDDFRRLALEVTQDLAANGVRYAEAVFSPSNHAARLGGDWFGPIEAVLDGLAAGERETGTVVRLDPDIVRDLRHGGGRPRAGGRAEVRGARRGGAELRRERAHRHRPLRATLPAWPRRPACAPSPTRASGPGRATSGRRSSTCAPTASATA